MPSNKDFVQSLLEEAHITINGSDDYDLQIKNPEFYNRVIREGVLGLGESYMDGWWEVNKLDDFFFRLVDASLHEKVKTWKMASRILKAKMFNAGRLSKAYHVGKVHYDLGNHLFKKMLDKRMVYSCGYWKNASTLDQAQEDKLDLICRKLYLKPGMKILDVGCGWGSFCKFAAENYGAEVVGVTISKEQAELARQLCTGLKVDIQLLDYRKLNPNMQFDRIVSVGMFEHVGYKNYHTFMQMMHRLLNNDGLLLLHTIGANKSLYTTDPWTDKYIFPNSMLPSITQIGSSIEKLFVMEDWHNFGHYYDQTLMAWYDNFNNSWNELQSEYDDRFYRMWKYYLLSCAGAFRARKNQLWQIVLSKNGVKNGYQPVR